MNDTDITNKTIYLCDDTIEGIFTAIYKAWDNNPKTTDVRIRSSSSVSSAPQAASKLTETCGFSVCTQ